MPNQQKADVVIIGGGIIGTAIARELSKYQLQVLLLEKAPDLSTGTTKGNSGILHAGFDPKPHLLKAKTNVRGNLLYKQLQKELQLDIKWTGSLVVAKTDEEMDTLQELLLRGQENGVPDLAILSREQTLEREPNLSPDIKGSLLAPTAGVIWPFGAAVAFAQCAVQNGVKILLDCEVQGFEIKNQQITAVNTSQGKINTKFVINAAGLEADNISRLAGDDSFAIKARKGEYILFDVTSARKLVTSIVFPTPSKLGKGILVCTTTHGNVFIGPNAESIEDKNDTATTTQGMNHIIEKARSLLPNIPLNTVITEFSGLRAIADTDDFIVRASTITNGLIHAAGMQSPGITAAPAIAELIATEIQNSGLELKEKIDFNPTLKPTIVFKKLGKKAKTILIKQNPLYGRIICRCETVTEAEIVNAIHAPCGARTLDGIKRRLRAGMGRCQSGFCGPRVTAILARELGVKITDIVKETAASQLFYDKLGAQQVNEND